jgi:tetratricopeptide (TPR) repeat protein
MAPEQATGKPVDQRADIYAFGLILSEMLVGKRGSSGGDTALALLIERASHAPPRMRTIDPTIPEALDRVVARCVEPDPAARYQTTKDLEEALERLDAEGHERHAPPAAAVAPPARGARWPGVAAAIALGLALAFGAWVLIGPAANAPAPAAVAYSPKLVLIADFDNKANDPVFAGSLEQALNIGIEGASFITTYSRTGAQALLAQLKPGSSLDEPSARLIAASQGINVVLTGSVETRGAGYLLKVRAVDPADGKELATAEASVPDKASVLKGVESVASTLRSQLGDTTSESARRAAAETVTTTSLDALHSYSIAQDLSSTGRWVESIEHYQKAISLDGNFGRAYSGWGTSLHNLGRRDESADVWKKALPLMDRMTDRERYRTLGAYFLGPGLSYKEAIDNYTKLVASYPTDRAGEHNLALAYFQALDLPQAIAHGRRAVDIYPKDTRARNNLALYLMYSGDFKAAAEEANTVLQENPAQYKAYLPLAAAAFASSDLAAARGVYERMAKVGTAAASTANHGLADLAMYEGKWAEAGTILTAGVAEDEKSKNRVARSAKLIALAEVRLAEGQNAQALTAIKEALAIREDATLVPAALVQLKAGRTAEARAIADELTKQFQPRSRAYGAIVQADIARSGGRLVEGMDMLAPAQKLADLWLGRYVLGVINVEAGRYPAALGELNQCLKRQGETTAVFLDDMPTLRLQAPLKYWLGRAQEGLSNATAAAEHYQAFLALRPADSRDPLATDARKRLAALSAAR